MQDKPKKSVVKIFKILIFPAVLVALLLYAMFNIQEKLMFYPEKLSEDFQFTFPWEFEEISFQNHGVNLHALFFPVKNPRGCIIYFHGNAGSLRSWGYAADDFIRRGFNFFILDFRGYGKSGGSISGEQMLHDDAELFYNEAVKRCSGQKIIIYGRSIGSGVASSLALRHTPDLLVLETPYSSLPDLAVHHFPFFPKALVKYQLNVKEDVKKLQCPVALIHGTYDSVIPHSMSLEIFQKDQKNQKLFIIEGGGHNNLTEFSEFQKALDLILP
ncbi:MAG: lysophospholipase [Spirochaetia bacterium]|nr:lysophospholipase [Spirochaetia bacterium]